MVGTSSLEPMLLTEPTCLGRFVARLDAKAELLVNVLYQTGIKCTSAARSIHLDLLVSTCCFAFCV